jgi:outer membrane receptor protein involved in Fe transport
MMASLILIAAIAGATPAGPAGEGGEIVVTGERMARGADETQSSLRLFTAAEIDAQAAPDRLEQLLQLTPNIQLGSGGEGPAIRGIDGTGPLRDLPAFLGGTRPRVTVEVDGRAISYNELAFGNIPLWDVAQVEIYRSPQTTTQGRNAIAGAIFVATEMPSPSWTGRARLIAGDARTRQASAMLSGPIAEGEIAFRLAADVRRSRTQSRITSPASIDPNRDDSDTIRAKLLVTPHFLPGSRIDLVFTHNRAQMPQFEGVQAPFRARRDPQATYGIFRTRVDAATARLTQALAPRLELKATISHGWAAIRRFAPKGFGETRNRGRDLSGEAVLDWRATPRLRIIGGSRAERSSLIQDIDLSVTPVGIGRFADRQHSLGLFGQTEWNGPARLTLAGGLRYQRDVQRRSGALAGIFGTVPLDFRGRFDAWLPRLALSWRAAPGLEAGLLYQRAYNPGGTTLDLRNGTAQTFGAESLWDKELFLRARLPGGALRLSLNLFDEAISNAQRPIARQLVTPRGTVGYAEIVNAPRAYSRGAEAEIGWRPSRALAVNAAIGVLGTRITRTEPVSAALQDRRFQRAPGLTAALSLDWRPTRMLRLSGQMRHNGRYFSDDVGSAALSVGPATILDAQARWTAGRITLFGYARNAADAFHLTWRFAPIPGRAQLGTLVDKREIGAGIEARF